MNENVEIVYNIHFSDMIHINVIDLIISKSLISIVLKNKMQLIVIKLKINAIAIYYLLK